MKQYRVEHLDGHDAFLSQEEAEATALAVLKYRTEKLLQDSTLYRFAKFINMKEKPSDGELLRKLKALPYADQLLVFAGAFGTLGIYLKLADEESEIFKVAKTGLLGLAREYPNRLDIRLFVATVGTLRPDARLQWVCESGSLSYGGRFKRFHLTAPLSAFLAWSALPVLHEEQDKVDRERDAKGLLVEKYL